MNVNEQMIARAIRSVLGENYQDAGSKQTQISRMTANITLNAAEALMKKVEAEARQMGLKVVTAVANAHGNIVAVRCMDDSYIGSFDVAVNKAYTSVAFKMTTETLGRYSQPGGGLYGIQLTNQGRIVNFGGGAPLKVGEDIIGGIGVSGGSAEQDIHLADFAVEAFREITGQK